MSRGSSSRRLAMTPPGCPSLARGVARDTSTTAEALVPEYHAGFDHVRLGEPPAAASAVGDAVQAVRGDCGSPFLCSGGGIQGPDSAQGALFKISADEARHLSGVGGHGRRPGQARARRRRLPARGPGMHAPDRAAGVVHRGGGAGRGGVARVPRAGLCVRADVQNRFNCANAVIPSHSRGIVILHVFAFHPPRVRHRGAGHPRLAPRSGRPGRREVGGGRGGGLDQRRRQPYPGR